MFTVSECLWSLLYIAFDCENAVGSPWELNMVPEHIIEYFPVIPMHG